MPRRGGFVWAPLISEWDRLLSLMAKSKTTGTKFSKNDGSLLLGEHDIQRFAFLEHQPRRIEKRAAQLALLVAHKSAQLKDQNFPGWRLYQSGVAVWECSASVDDFLNTGDTEALQTDARSSSGISVTLDDVIASTPRDDIEALVTKALRSMIGIDLGELDRICRRFFDARDLKSVARERSYYVAYRCSTQPPEIVRTFLIIDGPELSGVGAFSFTHVYEAQRKKIKRITRGMLLGLEDAYYFIGASAKLLHGRDEKNRPRLDRTSGLKMIAIPETQARTNEQVPAGVYMSNSLNVQPIVGRIALLHLGYKSVVGELTDEAIRPGIVVSSDKLADDIRGLTKIPNVSPQAEDADELAKEILMRINNLPYCDRKRGDLQTVGGIRALHAEDGLEPGP